MRGSWKISLKEKWDNEDRRCEINNEIFKLRNENLKIGHKLSVIESEMRGIFGRIKPKENKQKTYTMEEIK